ncbi:hypothetical protein CPB84DRAFT_1848052 [Gymnopilus junonius]|uniref:Uncharacterized protein n=1 Tax=Gymnopilus junonius TaxID=109634 RepID=A0A9P5NIX7_GYMJU|nr:hypothetical protein CPB84DRAFT_1848052 [Gymnopilus junonius]
MSFRGLFKFAFLAAHVVVGIASPLDSRASEELVQTPAGLFPKSNVHAVPHGAKVHQSPTEVQIIGANGTVIHSVPYSSNPRSAGVLPKPPSASANISRRALQSGYIAYAYWENTASSPISFLGTNWNVPPTPASWDGQLLYWWNGLVPLISTESYNLYYNTAFLQLEEESVARYLVARTNEFGGHVDSGGVTTYSYSSTFVGYPSTTISASTTVVLNWVYEALEIYTTAQLSDLPTGSLEFSAIEVTLQNGQHPSSLGWTPISDSTDGITMSILSSSATAGALLISTPSSVHPAEYSPQW